MRIEGTRPFKPTDIPSPIYGFKERTEKYKPTLQMENKESGKEKNTSSIDQEKQRIQKPLFDQSTIVMVKEDPKNPKAEEVQEISSLQKVEMEAVVEPNHLPILEEQEEVSEVVELATEPEEVPEVTRNRGRYRGNRISTTARGRSSYRGTKYRARRSTRSNRITNRTRGRYRGNRISTTARGFPAIVELNTEPEEVPEAIEQ